MEKISLGVDKKNKIKINKLFLKGLKISLFDMLVFSELEQRSSEYMLPAYLCKRRKLHKVWPFTCPNIIQMIILH